VELTDDERTAALENAQRTKWSQLKSVQYRWDLLNPPPPPRISAAQLRTAKLAEAAAQGWDFSQDDAAGRLFAELCSYFSTDDTDLFAFGTPDAPRRPRDPRKGLLLVGPVGCGKTTLLRLFMRNPRQPYGLLSTRKVSERYQEEGLEGLAIYRQAGRGGICFDDLGAEAMSVRHYGSEANPMAETLLARYDNFQEGRLPGGFTHLTSNLPVGSREDAPGTPSLYGCYGVRVVDRIREMFTLIAFPADAPSRRA
jgi:hypothetical protein